MLRRRRFPRVVAAALWFALAGTCVVVLPARGQGIENIVRSSGRMFPGVGADVRAIKRDSAGHYYILAKPQNTVWVYGADGQRLGQIPNAHSGGATIGYAADIDVDSSGDLLVADRGSNAVDIFRPDGSLAERIPVLAPMSLVALSGGRFAVVTLRSDYLVAIFDEQGRRIFHFGDPAELGIKDSPDSMRDLGKIYGDANGHIYFAFTSLPDPTIRKYDPVGYVAYSASLPISDFDFANKPEDRVQFGINVSQFNFSEQVGAWATIGTSGALHFGSGVGTGLGERMRGFMGPGGGNGFGGGGPGPGGLGNPNAPAYPGGVNSVGVFGQGSLEHGSLHFNMGARLGGRNGAPGRSGPRGGAAGPSDATDSSDSGGLAPGAVLQFDTSNGFGSGASNNANGSSDDTEILSTTQTDQSDSQDSVLSTSPDNSPFATDLGVLNYQPGMFGGSMGFRPPPPHFGRAGGGVPGGAVGAGAFRPGDLAGAHFSPSGFPLGSPGAGTAGHFPMFGPPGHFVFNLYNVEASVRINLDRPAPNSREKPALTAIGVDPETGEAWAAIGNALVHLAKDGAELGTYYVATPDGAPLRPDAILVEHDRLLLAVDPLGIYSVARPDLGSPGTPSQSNVTAQPARPSD